MIGVGRIHKHKSGRKLKHIPIRSQMDEGPAQSLAQCYDGQDPLCLLTAKKLQLGCASLGSLFCVFCFVSIPLCTRIMLGPGHTAGIYFALLCYFFSEDRASKSFCFKKLDFYKANNCQGGTHLPTFRCLQCRCPPLSSVWVPIAVNWEEKTLPGLCSFLSICQITPSLLFGKINSKAKFPTLQRPLKTLYWWHQNQDSSTALCRCTPPFFPT